LTDRVESRAYLTAFFGCDDTGVLQRPAIRDACRDVYVEEPAVEAKGVIELGKPRIGLPLKSPTPKFFGFSHWLHRIEVLSKVFNLTVTQPSW
jgi:hypothetical protein